MRRLYLWFFKRKEWIKGEEWDTGKTISFDPELKIRYHVVAILLRHPEGYFVRREYVGGRVK